MSDCLTAGLLNEDTVCPYIHRIGLTVEDKINYVPQENLMELTESNIAYLHQLMNRLPPYQTTEIQRLIDTF